MLGEIERLNEQNHETSQTRIWIDTERTAVDHHGTEIEILFRYWRERAFLEDDVPALANFYPPSERTPWVDVSAANPLAYTMRNHPAGICGDWNRTPFAEHPIPMHARACAREYYGCKSLRAPAYIYTQQKMLGVDREYAKLLLPVSDDTGTVTRIYYAWRFIREPIILSSMN